MDFGFVNTSLVFVMNVSQNLIMPENAITQSKQFWNLERKPPSKLPTSGFSPFDITYKHSTLKMQLLQINVFLQDKNIKLKILIELNSLCGFCYTTWKEESKEEGLSEWRLWK